MEGEAGETLCPHLLSQPLRGGKPNELVEHQTQSIKKHRL